MDQQNLPEEYNRPRTIVEEDDEEEVDTTRAVDDFCITAEEDWRFGKNNIGKEM